MQHGGGKQPNRQELRECPAADEDLPHPALHNLFLDLPVECLRGVMLPLLRIDRVTCRITNADETSRNKPGDKQKELVGACPVYSFACLCVLVRCLVNVRHEPNCHFSSGNIALAFFVTDCGP